MGWLGPLPPAQDLGPSVGSDIPSSWMTVEADRQLRCGLRCVIQRRGFSVYDFSGANVGRRASGPGMRTLGEASEASKPALVQRLRVVNAHLTLIHAASMTLAGESPTVLRVRDRDLYRHDYDDAGEPVWFRRYGEGLPAKVTDVDRARLNAPLAPGLLDRSLDWLDEVVGQDLLVVFDLLNLVQESLATHDYALAVTAGWTVCELRTRSLVSPLGSRIRKSKSVEVLRALETAGLLPASVGTRLDDLRRSRND